MSNQEVKIEPKNISNSFREKINKNLGVILLFFMLFIIILFVTLQININNFGIKVEINREQYTEIYMQLQELTGMISNEAKREFYISKIVNEISYNNHTLDSKFIYEVSKAIYEESIKYNFNPLLTTALIKVESNFDPKAISDSYAYGLCQVRSFIAPELSKNIGIEWGGAEKTLFDPIKNIKIGLYYLNILNRDFNDLKTAIIAYNQGPYKIQEQLTNKQELDQEYINKILDYYTALRGFSFEEKPDEIIKNNK